MFVSQGIVIVLMPATILWLGIGPAVAVHEGSTLLVVTTRSAACLPRSKAGGVTRLITVESTLGERLQY